MSKRMYDAAFPPPDPPPWEVVAGYLGGDTPHTWTPAEWNAQPARYRLPIWVQSDPTMNDGPECVDAARALGVPAGVSVALDLETASGSPYVQQFIDTLHAAGYTVLVYGSLDTIFDNPAGDGRWIAYYTGVSNIYPGSVATQWADDTMLGKPYDASEIADSVPLWDTQGPAPAQEEDMGYIGELADGQNVITPISIPAGSCKAIGFTADTGLAGTPAAQLRVAYRLGTNDWKFETVAVDSTKPKAVVAFPDGAPVDGISVKRLDAAAVKIAWDAS